MRHRQRQTVWKDVKRAQKAFRLAENLGTHTARKVYAAEMFDRYGDLRRVQRALNHDSMEVTALYAMADQLTRRRLARRKKGQVMLHPAFSVDDTAILWRGRPCDPLFT